jgi:hypothetical protein
MTPETVLLVTLRQRLFKLTPADAIRVVRETRRH